MPEKADINSVKRKMQHFVIKCCIFYCYKVRRSDNMPGSELLTTGILDDMYVDSQNNGFAYAEMAMQADFGIF